MKIVETLKAHEKDCQRKVQAAGLAVQEAAARKPFVLRDLLIAEVNGRWAQLELAAVRLRFHEVTLAQQETHGK